MAKLPVKTLMLDISSTILRTCGLPCTITCRGLSRGNSYSGKHGESKQIMKRWSKKTDRYMQGTVAKLQGHRLSKSAKKKKFYAPLPMFAASQKAMPVDASPMLVNNPHPNADLGKERRSQQLSVIIFDLVSSMVNSGEICPEFVDLGFHLSKVFIPKDIGSINVHWFATGTEKDEEIAKLLKKSAGEVRCALTSLQVMGTIPPVVFVRDMSRAKLAEVERLLKVADMGPDFKPTDIGDKFRNIPEISTEYGESHQEDIEELFEERRKVVESILKEREQEQLQTALQLNQALVDRNKCIESNLNESLKDMEEKSDEGLDSEQEQRIKHEIAKELEKSVVIPKPHASKQEVETDNIVASNATEASFLSPSRNYTQNIKPKAALSKEAYEEIIQQYDGINFTHDIYELDHVPLVEKVRLAKLKVKDRNYMRDEAREVERGTFTEVNKKLDLDGLSANKIRESLNRADRKVKRSKKTIERLLDSRLHRNAEASVTSVQFLPEDERV